MNLRYAGVILIILLAGCSASHTASPTSVIPGAPSQTSQRVDPFNLNAKNVIQRYSLPNAGSEPFFMAIGSDKNVWFTERLAGNIGRITPGGVITEYAIPSGLSGEDIAAGASGTLWFGECNYTDCGFNPTNIDKITTAGHITEFPLPVSHCASGVTKGPDGNMWFTDPCANAGWIGKITPTGMITEYPLTSGHSFYRYYIADIVAGPDGNLWFDEQGYVGKITTNGTITEYPGPDGDGLYSIAVGPDGNLYGLDDDGIWEITTAGVITDFVGRGTAYDMILGPDKQLWISGYFGQNLYEFNPRTHLFSNNIAPDPGKALGGLALSSDGDVWIAGFGNNTIDVYEEKITTIGIRLNGELSFTDPNYGFELGYAVGTTSTQTQTISLAMGESVKFKNVDTIPHSAAFLGDATGNSAPWPGTFNGSTTKSPPGTAIGTTGWATGSLNPNKTSPIYETGLPGFYMIGCQYHYNTNEMRTVIVVH